MLAALSPFLLLGIWLNGKRHIVVMTILSSGPRSSPNRRRYGLFPGIAIAGVLGAGFAIYSYAYQASIAVLEVVEDSATTRTYALILGETW